MKSFILLLLVPPIIFGIKNDNLTLGIPGDADTIIDREGYALGYSEKHEQSLWVIYKLTAYEVQNKVAGRSDKFRYDPEIPSGSTTPQDYLKSGYDRGHLAPAADMAWSQKAMDESFYMSNISPQKPSCNRGIWSKLEAQVRAFAVVEKEIYVVTGAIFSEEPVITIGANKIAVPTHFYKVIYDITPPQKMIAFIILNEKSSKSLQYFAVTVDTVEESTSLDFFSLLPLEEQDKLESQINIKDWNWNE